MSILTEDERDAFTEAFNIGICKAAASLSEMIGEEISLTVPTVNILQKQHAIEVIKNSQSFEVRGVREEFRGQFSGCAFLLFPGDSSMALVKLLLGEDFDLDSLSEMEEEALIEVGNILLNACLGAIADISGLEIDNQIPEFVQGEISDIGGGGEQPRPDALVMNLRVEFLIESIDVEGHISLVMDIYSLDAFRQRLADYFGYDTAIAAS